MSILGKLENEFTIANFKSASSDYSNIMYVFLLSMCYDKFYQKVQEGTRNCYQFFVSYGKYFLSKLSDSFYIKFIGFL